MPGRERKSQEVNHITMTGGKKGKKDPKNTDNEFSSIFPLKHCESKDS